VPVQTVIPSLASAKDFVGRHLGISGWAEVSQAQVDAFAAATGDRQWIHVDPERARSESPWRGTVAHGFLTIALAPVLMEEIVEVRGCRLLVNTGVDKLRLRAPIPTGSRVRMAADLVSARDLPGGGVRVGVAVRFEVEGQKRPACVGQVNLAYLP